MHNVSMVAVASSVQGYAHKKKNVPNQDTFSYLIDEKYGIFVAIVSDGAGSAVNSKQGSSFCCYNLNRSLIGLTIDLLENRISDSWFDEMIVSRISEHIDFLIGLNEDIKTFHHTMSAVIAFPNGGKIIQIGDSPVVVVNAITPKDIEDVPKISNSIVFDEEKQGGYVNLTHFLTSPNWRNYLQISDLPKNAIAIFLMSDGAGSIFIPNKNLHEPAMLELLKRFKSYQRPIDEVLAEFLDMKEINSKTADDKTIIAYFPKKWIGNYTLSSQYSSSNISEDIFNFLGGCIAKNLDSDDSSRMHTHDIGKQVITLPKTLNNDKAYSEE